MYGVGDVMFVNGGSDLPWVLGTSPEANKGRSIVGLSFVDDHLVAL